MIRATQAELGARQIQLIEAHERNLNPAELGVEIAHLGRKISSWKREQEVLFRKIAGEQESELLPSAMRTFFLDRLNAQRCYRKA